MPSLPVGKCQQDSVNHSPELWNVTANGASLRRAVFRTKPVNYGVKNGGLKSRQQQQSACRHGWLWQGGGERLIAMAIGGIGGSWKLNTAMGYALPCASSSSPAVSLGQCCRHFPFDRET